MKARGFYTYLEHSEMGTMAHEGVTSQLSETPGRLERCAPLLGEHNDYVFQELLGMREDEVNDLFVDGIIG
jgi:crotonobetainyl-CoA:carnitine CoA-transferase CaiB-like acyl-CoA transferase